MNRSDSGSPTPLSGSPPLPATMSSDGREIWDWAGRFSEHVHRVNRIAELTRDIARVGTRCGDCDKWMKSRECPREHNANGKTRGPSMDGLTCVKFVEDRFATKHRAELQAKLHALNPPSESQTNG